MNFITALATFTALALANDVSPYPGVSRRPNITIFLPNTHFAPSPLPPPFAASKGECIVSAFSNIGRSTAWNLVKKIDFGEFVEPEGIVRIGDDRYFVSNNEYYERTVKFPNNEIINGTDRTPGIGLGFITVLDGEGRRIARVALNDVGDLEYHNGGIDFDGRYVWANIAQYRPNSTSILIRVDPITLGYTRIAHFHDHTGGPIHDVQADEVVSLNWGSRNATSIILRDMNDFPAFTSFKKVVRNPSYYIDYQDCKFLGRIRRFANKPHMFCGGIASFADVNLGGLAIVDMETMMPRMEVPITLRSENGWLLTTNPVDVDCVNGRLQVYFFPDQEVSNATLYAYEADPNSLFEFGGGPQ